MKKGNIVTNRERTIRYRVLTVHRDGSVSVKALFNLDAQGNDRRGYIGENYRVDDHDLVPVDQVPITGLKALGPNDMFIRDQINNPVATIAMRADAAQISALFVGAPDLLIVLKRWQAFAKTNGWTDMDHHDANGTGWISATDEAIAKAEGR